MTNQVKVAIPFHSGYGHTAVVAQAVKRGVESTGAVAELIEVQKDGSIPDVAWETLDNADAIIFGSPTYMASASGQFKIFMDNSSKSWFQRKWQDKLAGAFTVSHSLSGDKLNTLVQLSLFAAQHGMLWVSQGLVGLEGENHQRDPNGINRLGSFLGVMAQAENAGPEVTPPSGDIKSGELYGARIALAAKKWYNK